MHYEHVPNPHDISPLDDLIVFQETFPNGDTALHYKGLDSTTTEFPDGTRVFGHDSGMVEVHHPSGKIDIYNTATGQEISDNQGPQEEPFL